MTYDELLARLSETAILTETFNNRAVARALRAVVELHKPNWMKRCEACYEIVSHCDFINELYPCPTIQAIEKELK